ncbi:MAG: hypothetical protein BRC32_05590 [Actinobacteria bacterium QS_8_72_14]|nr:MAG: hypothetical protein BRC32_05590 [Actinobacteria bacterium QS_8_72_14]
MAELPLLSLLIALPALGAVALALLPAGAVGAIRWVALAAAGATFVVAVVVLAVFETGEAGFQLGEAQPWIPQWGIAYRLGVDGISLLLVLLTTLLMPLVVLAGWNQQHRTKGFFIALLAMEAAMVGVFLALDLILFYAFFEVMLVPMYALIGIWGGVARRYASIKFFLYTLIGGLLMLVAILYLYWAAGAVSFNYATLQAVALSETEQLWLFAALFVAFAVKVPLFPLHTWLPDAHTEAPTVGSVILAAVLLKIGGYGFLRYSLPLFPEATATLAPALLALGVVGVLIAYSSVSHLGFVILGAFALNGIGAAGSVVQMVNHGLSTGALFLLVGFLYDRTHSREISAYSGLLTATPVLGGLFLVTVLSSLALPGLNGFTGEFPILLGTFQSAPWAAVLAALGVVLTAIYLLWAYQRMFHGPVTGHAQGLSDLTGREIAVIAPLVVLMLGIGLYPEPLYERVNPSVQRVIAEYADVEAADTAPAAPPASRDDDTQGVGR